jgi:hypothetical protein
VTVKATERFDTDQGWHDTIYDIPPSLLPQWEHQPETRRQIIMGSSKCVHDKKLPAHSKEECTCDSRPVCVFVKRNRSSPTRGSFSFAHRCTKLWQKLKSDTNTDTVECLRGCTQGVTAMSEKKKKPVAQHGDRWINSEGSK